MASKSQCLVSAKNPPKPSQHAPAGLARTLGLPSSAPLPRLINSRGHPPAVHISVTLRIHPARLLLPRGPRSTKALEHRFNFSGWHYACHVPSLRGRGRAVGCAAAAVSCMFTHSSPISKPELGAVSPTSSAGRQSVRVAHRVRCEEAGEEKVLSCQSLELWV